MVAIALFFCFFAVAYWEEGVDKLIKNADSALTLRPGMKAVGAEISYDKPCTPTPNPEVVWSLSYYYSHRLNGSDGLVHKRWRATL